MDASSDLPGQNLRSIHPVISYSFWWEYYLELG